MCACVSLLHLPAATRVGKGDGRCAVGLGEGEKLPGLG